MSTVLRIAPFISQSPTPSTPRSARHIPDPRSPRTRGSCTCRQPAPTSETSCCSRTPATGPLRARRPGTDPSLPMQNISRTDSSAPRDAETNVNSPVWPARSRIALCSRNSRTAATPFRISDSTLSAPPPGWCVQVSLQSIRPSTFRTESVLSIAATSSCTVVLASSSNQDPAPWNFIVGVRARISPMTHQDSSQQTPIVGTATLVEPICDALFHVPDVNVLAGFRVAAPHCEEGRIGRACHTPPCAPRIIADYSA